MFMEFDERRRYNILGSRTHFDFFFFLNNDNNEKEHKYHLKCRLLLWSLRWRQSLNQIKGNLLSHLPSAWIIVQTEQPNGYRL